MADFFDWLFREQNKEIEKWRKKSMNENRNQHQNDEMKEITNKLNPCQIKGTLNTFTITKTFHCLSIFQSFYQSSAWNNNGKRKKKISENAESNNHIQYI